jgi:hypothetical protein
MRKWLLLLATLIFAAVPLAAQQRLNIDIPDLADRAAETTDITLDGSMLRLAAKFLNSDGDHEIGDIVKGLQAVYVRSYEFDREGQYDRGVIDKVRSQLGPSWKRMVKVYGHRENTEIYLDMSSGDTPKGLLVLSAEPRELTIVHLVGSIDIDRLASLEGNFGIPRISGNEHKEKSEHKGKREKKEKSDKEDDDE